MDKTAMLALLVMLGLLVACHEPATTSGVVTAAAMCSEAQKAQAAIDRTEAFFSAMGNPVRLSAYGLGEEVIDQVAAKLTAHGHVALGEHADITPDDVKQILRLAL